MFTEIQLQTRKQEEFISITRILREAVEKSGTKDGIVIIQVPHTTAGITINESADPDVVNDIVRMLNVMILIVLNIYIKKEILQPTLKPRYWGLQRW